MKKIVFITGASSGFGYLIVNQLLEGGRHRIIAAIRGGEQRGAVLFSHANSKISNGDLIFIDLELDKSDSLKNGITLAKTFMSDGLDILINNAGIGLLGPLELQSEEQIRLQFETNFFAPLLITKELIPYLRKSKGKILNMSSLVGFTVFPFYGTYAASKHAIDILTESLHYDLSEFGIQVCTIEPGGFKTQFSSNILLGDCLNGQESFYQKRIDKFKKFLIFVEEKVEKEPRLVANAIVKLCNKKRIPIRLRIGSEVHFNWILKKLTPDQWRIRFQNWFYQKFLF